MIEITVQDINRNNIFWYQLDPLNNNKNISRVSQAWSDPENPRQEDCPGGRELQEGEVQGLLHWAQRVQVREALQDVQLRRVWQLRSSQVQVSFDWLILNQSMELNDSNPRIIKY